MPNCAEEIVAPVVGETNLFMQSLTDIALKNGFPDLKTLTARFRSTFQRTPAQYRAALKPYHALQIGAASKVVPIDKLSVVITLALAFVVLHEPFTAKSLIGCALITAGTLFMVL